MSGFSKNPRHVALMAECSQLVDTGSGYTHEVTIDAEELLALRVLHLLKDYPRISSELMSLMESLEESDSQDEEMGEEIIPAGPTLKFVDLSIEKRIRSHMVDVVAHLSGIEDENDIHVIKILSISSEVTKTQAIARDLIDSHVQRALRSRIIDDDDIDELIKAVTARLEGEGFTVSHY
ncbi:MAG: hypothetical protein EAX95_09640 [Candidatus Thorarchaeota archaeon]|nr:hypothetical protein [Candidatus Thorarchaeota archaeon]